MTDDDRIEGLLRARPRADARYEPTLADALDAISAGSPVVGSVSWRGGDSRLIRVLVFVALAMSLVLATAVMLVGGSARHDLVVVGPSPEATTQLSFEPVPIFPTDEVTTILDRFKTSHWGDHPNIVVDLAIQRNDRLWAAISGKNLDSTMGEGFRAGQTFIRIGATGHLIVAAGVLLLVDRGRIDPSAPISRYLPDWPNGDRITVGNLLDGSSGVASFGNPVEDLMNLVAAEPGHAWTADDALRIARAKPPRFEVGARHDPVDTEDALLEAVVVAATGSTVADVVAAALHGPVPLPPDSMSPYVVTLPVGVVPPPVAGYWDPTSSGTLVELADLPADVLTVLGRYRGITEQTAGLARLYHEFHVAGENFAGRPRMMLGRSLEEGGSGGMAMCPCSGGTRNGVGLVGHTGPYTALAVYVPSERLTISIVANAPVSDEDLQGLLQEIHDLVWPAIS